MSGFFKVVIREVVEGSNVFTSHPEVVQSDKPATLQQLQDVVGGYIETMFRVNSPFRKNITLSGYVNEEGLLISLPIILAVRDEYGHRPFAGNIVVVAENDSTGDADLMTDEELEFIRSTYRSGVFFLPEQSNA